LPIGARLPSEHDLCDEHGMSRGTVRKHCDLEDVGMITRSRAGTTVTATQPLDDTTPAPELDEIMDLVQEHQAPASFFHRGGPRQALAKRSGVDVGSHWYLLADPRRERDPTKACAGASTTTVTSPARTLPSWQHTLESVASTTLEQVVTAEPMREDLAAALGVEPASAALVVRRTHRDAEGVVMKVSLHTHRGDRYRITTTFQGVSDLV
jgi:DNA-binding GntR family transcriptional regulator